MSAQEYTKRLREAFIASRPWMYDGREGALRLAWEYGSCLTDSPVNAYKKGVKKAKTAREILKEIGYEEELLSTMTDEGGGNKRMGRRSRSDSWRRGELNGS